MFARTVKSPGDFRYDELISGLQKAIRRRDEALAIFVLNELFTAEQLNPSCITNIRNRLRIIFFEDVGLGSPDTGLLLPFLFDSDEPITHEEAVFAARTLCRAPSRSRAPSYFRAAYLTAAAPAPLPVGAPAAVAAATAIAQFKLPVGIREERKQWDAISVSAVAGTLPVEAARLLVEYARRTFFRLSPKSTDKTMLWVAAIMIAHGFYNNGPPAVAAPREQVDSLLEKHRESPIRELPAWVKDKHTGAGRRAGCDLAHFATVGAVVADEWLPPELEAARALYMAARCAPAVAPAAVAPAPAAVVAPVVAVAPAAPPPRPVPCVVSEPGPLLNFKPKVAFLGEIRGAPWDGRRCFLKFCGADVRVQDSCMPVLQLLANVKTDIGLPALQVVPLSLTLHESCMLVKKSFEHKDSNAKWVARVAPHWPMPIHTDNGNRNLLWMTQPSVGRNSINYQPGDTERLIASRSGIACLVKTLLFRAAFGIGDTNLCNLIFLPGAGSEDTILSVDEEPRRLPFPVGRLWAQAPNRRVNELVAAWRKENVAAERSFRLKLQSVLVAREAEWAAAGLGDLHARATERLADPEFGVAESGKRFRGEGEEEE